MDLLVPRKFSGSSVPTGSCVNYYTIVYLSWYVRIWESPGGECVTGSLYEQCHIADTTIIASWLWDSPQLVPICYRFPFSLIARRTIRSSFGPVRSSKIRTGVSRVVCLARAPEVSHWLSCAVLRGYPLSLLAAGIAVDCQPPERTVLRPIYGREPDVSGALCKPLRQDRRSNGPRAVCYQGLTGLELGSHAIQLLAAL